VLIRVRVRVVPQQASVPPSVCAEAHARVGAAAVCNQLRHCRARGASTYRMYADDLHIPGLRKVTLVMPLAALRSSAELHRHIPDTDTSTQCQRRRHSQVRWPGSCKSSVLNWHWLSSKCTAPLASTACLPGPPCRKAHTCPALNHPTQRCRECSHARQVSGHVACGPAENSHEATACAA
jgi:hypothetical protein